MRSLCRRGSSSASTSGPFAVEVAKVTLMLARKLAADELGDERTYLPPRRPRRQLPDRERDPGQWPDFDVCVGNPPYLGARTF